MIFTIEVEKRLGVGEQAVGKQKFRVAGHCLVQQFGSFEQALSSARIERRSIIEELGPDIKIMRDQIAGRPFIQRCLLWRRQFRLQLPGNPFRNLALNGEDIGQIAIVGISPKVRICARIDELRAHSHFSICPAHASFENVGHAERLSDFTQVSLRAGSISHHAGARDYFQVGHFRKRGQDVVLDAIREKFVLFALAEILKGKNRDAFFGNGSSRCSGGSRGRRRGCSSRSCLFQNSRREDDAENGKSEDHETDDQQR